MSAVEQLAKWRTLFTGWQLGTRPKGDPEGDAVRDHREATLLLQMRVAALEAVLTQRLALLTPAELAAVHEAEADLQCMSLEARFPGVRATGNGLAIDHRAAAWMKGWKP